MEFWRGSLEEMEIKRTVAVLIPAFNEEECLPELYERLCKLFDKESDYLFSCVLVDNGSSDSTWSLCKSISAKDYRFTSIKLSRNFGMDGALTAGLDQIDVDACVLMAADLQDPPECISDFLRKWEEGFENIYGVVKERKGTGIIRKFNSQLFYFLASYFSNNLIPKNVSDFRLLDRRAYQALRELKERNRFLRGLTAWIGFESVGVDIYRPERFGGNSKAFTGIVLDLAMKGIFSNSRKPLRLISIIGISSSALSLLAIIGLTIYWLLFGVPFAGFGSLIAVALLVFSALALMLGILSEYIGLIYEEIKQRPNYIISDIFQRD